MNSIQTTVILLKSKSMQTLNIVQFLSDLKNQKIIVILLNRQYHIIRNSTIYQIKFCFQERNLSEMRLKSKLFQDKN